MKKLEALSAVGWCIAGLLALRMLLAAQAPAALRPVVESIRRCELPAGTVVFVVRDAIEEAP